MRRTGWFACSDPLVDRLHENVVRSMPGNLVGIPTGFPQRDERLGWTGDIQVFAQHGPGAVLSCGHGAARTRWRRAPRRPDLPLKESVIPP